MRVVEINNTNKTKNKTNVLAGICFDFPKTAEFFGISTCKRFPSSAYPRLLQIIRPYKFNLTVVRDSRGRPVVLQIVGYDITRECATCGVL